MNLRILFIIGVIVLSSCKSDRERMAERLIDKINTIGMGNFDHVEYAEVGEEEQYSYVQHDTVVTRWTYNRLRSDFEGIDVRQLEKLHLAKDFPDSLRNRIHRLGISALTQSQLDGNIRRFWVNDAEMIIWRNPALKSDKNTVLIDEELGAMMKINDEWYYHRMKVCRNK